MMVNLGSNCSSIFNFGSYRIIPDFSSKNRECLPQKTDRHATELCQEKNVEILSGHEGNGGTEC